MSKKNFDFYIEFSYSKLNIGAYNIHNQRFEHFKQYTYENYFDKNKNLNFEEISKLLEKSIFDIEKITEEFVQNIFLMIETPESLEIQLSVCKNNEGNNVSRKDAMYLIQDARQQILGSNSDVGIIHIIVEKYILDNIYNDLLPSDVKCKKFSIDLKFICFQKKLLKDFEKLFLKRQIFIDKIICTNYAKTLSFWNEDKNPCEIANLIVQGYNKQEVVSVPKIREKTGFFEKLFHFFR